MDKDIILIMIVVIFFILLINIYIIWSDMRNTELCKSIGYEKYSGGEFGDEDYCVGKQGSQKVRIECGSLNCEIFKIDK